MQDTNPERLALTPKMKQEGARTLKLERLRLRMEAQIGKAPALNEEETFVRSLPFSSLH
jgi:hypothetical protein